MKNTNLDDIIRRLHELPEIEPPPKMIKAIIKRVEQPKARPTSAVLKFFLTPRPISFRPITLAVITCLLLIFVYIGPLSHKETGDIDTGSRIIDSLSLTVLHDEASFLLGRGLMAAGLTKEALPLLKRASYNVPDNPEYAYWEGLCFWANGMPDKERSSYQRGIDASPDTIPLLLNLGHNFLEEKNYEEALFYYNKVLSISSTEPTALYNRALIYHLQQKDKDELSAWRTYLEQYKFGINAFRAVQHLNTLNDFSYRIYHIGKRKIIMNQAALLNMFPQQTFDDNIETLTNYLSQDSSLYLDIIMFHERNTLIAKQKAIQLKQHLIARIGEPYRHQIRLSWFGEKETVQTPNGNKHLSESVLLFARNKKQLNQETKI